MTWAVEICFLQFLDTESSWSRCQQIWFLLRLLSLASRQPPPFCVFKWLSLIFPFLYMHQLYWISGHPYILTATPKRSHLKYITILRPWRLRLQHTNLEDPQFSSQQCHWFAHLPFCLIRELAQWQGHPTARSTINGQYLVHCRYLINVDWINKTMKLQIIEPKRIQTRRRRRWNENFREGCMSCGLNF